MFLYTVFLTSKIWLCFKIQGMNEGEAAELIVNEAREILQNDLGIAVNWNDKNATSPLGKRYQIRISLLWFGHQKIFSL